MWGLVVAAVLISVAGIYTSMSDQALSVSQSNVAMELAASMASYRRAVVDYFSQNDLRSTSVSMSTLKTSNVLPAWSALYQQSATPIWSNYRDADGIIYVYANALPSTNIISEITRLSNNSILAGIYRQGATTLQSAVFGDTNIPVLALAGKSVPDGAPVWIAMTK